MFLSLANVECLLQALHVSLQKDLCSLDIFERAHWDVYLNAEEGRERVVLEAQGIVCKVFRVCQDKLLWQPR